MYVAHIEATVPVGSLVVAGVVLREDRSTGTTWCGMPNPPIAYPQPKSDGRENWQLPGGYRWCARCVLIYRRGHPDLVTMTARLYR